LRLDPDATIAGQPIKNVRELLRRIDNGHWSRREIADLFHIDTAQAEALIAELAERGFLQVSELRGPARANDFTNVDPRGRVLHLLDC
jgi:hypothetical protein